MRKSILFFGMGSICESECTDKSSDILALSLDLLEKKQDEIKEKYNTDIYEHICSASDTEYMSDGIHHLWEKPQKKKPSSDSEKHEKMQSIESLATGDTPCKDRYDDTRDDEEYLKKIHKEEDKKLSFLITEYNKPHDKDKSTLDTQWTNSQYTS